MSIQGSKAGRFDRTLVEGPVSRAVWRIGWPTLLQNMIGGLQGLIDHVMVGQYVGYTANAAIGVSLQIFIVIIVFMGSLFTGMGVLIARFVGAGETEKVDRVFHQALLACLVFGLGVVAPVGYFAAPALLNLVHAAPDVREQALPFIRTLFLGNVGMMLFYMFSGALRAAGDAHTPLRLGALMTALNVVLNITLIAGLGPIPALGTGGAALGTVIASCTASGVGLWLVLSKRTVLHIPDRGRLTVDWQILRAIIKFGLPAGAQGIAMNVAGILMLRFIGLLPTSAEAQAAYAVGYTELFSFITWTSVGLMGATAAVAGQALGAGRPERAIEAAWTAARMGLIVAGVIGALFVLIPDQLLAVFGMNDARVVAIARVLLRFLAVSGLFVSVALTYTGALQGTGDTRAPLCISLVSQILVPIGWCTAIQMTRGLEATDIWLAIVLGHVTRAVLSVAKFRQGKWRGIRVDVGPAAA
ncbi:MAG: MATE family efflux transporter [Vicinamibacterales bacterium]